MDHKIEELLKQVGTHAEELSATAKRCQSEPNEKCPTNITERAMAAKLGLHLLREALVERPSAGDAVKPGQLGDVERADDNPEAEE